MASVKFEEFLGKVFVAMAGAMKPLACLYVCHPDAASAPKMAFERAFSDHFHKSATIIWWKQSAGMGWQDYRSQHEPILYGWKTGKGGKHYFSGDRTKSTVWEIGRDAQATYVHPTQKPVALPTEAIQNSCKPRGIVLDPFSGSGSTVIACEQSVRHCRAMELDARYADVSVTRWQNFTGQPARLEGDGRTFAEITENRRAA